MKSKTGGILMIIGAVLILSAVALLIYNRCTENAAADSANADLSLFMDAVSDNSEVYKEEDRSLLTEQTVTINGNEYIGRIDIAALGVSLPVRSQWSDAAAKEAPCRYTGSFLTDDMIIAAHNYRWHFGHISDLNYGDTVTFTDVLGVTYYYTVAGIEVLEADDFNGMLDGGWDLTLFTCTYGGRQRIIVRCTRQASDITREADTTAP